MTDLLTSDELAAIDLAARLAESLARVVGGGGTRNADLNELLVHVHVIQNAVLAQAAARAYPDRFRPLGGVVQGTPERDIEVNFISRWGPYAPWQVAEMTGRPEAEIRDQYGDTVNVRMDLRGPQEFRRGGHEPSPAELRETRATIVESLEAKGG